MGLNQVPSRILTSQAQAAKKSISDKEQVHIRQEEDSYSQDSLLLTVLRRWNILCTDQSEKTQSKEHTLITMLQGKKHYIGVVLL